VDIHRHVGPSTLPVFFWIVAVTRECWHEQLSNRKYWVYPPGKRLEPAAGSFPQEKEILAIPADALYPLQAKGIQIRSVDDLVDFFSMILY
jgi:hypothetical protein